MASHEIQVFVHLPIDTAKPCKLDHENWAWAHLLTFPVTELNERRFSIKPYKWIRFVTGTIIGAHGELSVRSTSPPVLCDYNHANDLPNESLKLYYHTSDEAKRGMLPIHPNMLNERRTASFSSFQDPGFRDVVARRDGNRCVLTEFPEDTCQAAHIVPVGKGDAV